MKTPKYWLGIALMGVVQLAAVAQPGLNPDRDPGDHSLLELGSAHSNLKRGVDHHLYMMFFPKGKRISQGGSGSCVAGGFCAYHSTFRRNGQYVFYGVFPDMSAGSGCDSGCGNGSAFGNQTSVASHELIEAVTDPAVGVATVFGPPLGWYDGNNGEIGDICNAQQGSIVLSALTYTVQKEWSNQKAACIVNK